MIIAMPPECSNSCVIRSTMYCHIIKSTIMKSMIVSNAQKSSREAWEAYHNYIKKNDNLYKPVKQKQKIQNHAIEKLVPKPKEKPVN